MKLLKKVFAFTFIFMLSVSGLTGYQVNASEEPKHLDILFTHDLHSHLNSFQMIVDGTQQETGGFARLKTLINEHEKENTDTLILDGGDFSMGTLIQTVYDTEAAELRMLGYLGCDVTTLGNHEFDYGSDGLADMLNAAASLSGLFTSLISTISFLSVNFFNSAFTFSISAPPLPITIPGLAV